MPKILNTPTTGILQLIYPVKKNHNDVIKLPAKILPHKRKEIEINGVICEITSNGFTITGIFLPFTLIQIQNFFK